MLVTLEAKHRDMAPGGRQDRDQAGGPRRPPLPGRDRQRGVALIFSLALVAVLTVVAVTVSNTSTLELRMAENDRLRQDLLARAERTLAQGEQAAQRFGWSPTFPWTQADEWYAPPGQPGALNADLSTPGGWAGLPAAQAGSPDDLYVVEYLGCEPLPGGGCDSAASRALRLFRVTAMSRQGASARILQSVVAVNYPLSSQRAAPPFPYRAGRIAWAELGIGAP
ncbi:MAG: hypothetical protein D6809_03955 [Gammaproteobacteria bacterium]|nr:MAG: hypothetical protein D6809_03955 [Gammaproteobacteria bacterium]